MLEDLLAPDLAPVICGTAANVVAVLNGWPVWPAAEDVEDVLPFLESPDPPHAAPSIVNADELGLARWVG